MTLDIYDAWGHPFAGAVYHLRPLGRDDRLAEFDDFAVREENRTVVDPAALSIIDGDIGHERGDARIGLVGRRVRIARIAFDGCARAFRLGIPPGTGAGERGCGEQPRDQSYFHY